MTRVPSEPGALRCVALVPARSGSKRVAGKNVRPLAGHPLVAYTIAAALESGVFAGVIVSTDSADIAGIARHYGAETPFLRPSALATDLSPDIGWVRHALDSLEQMGRSWESFSILRPTSPFRQAETIRRAWREFTAARDIDSLRAVEPCRQHPGKMWVMEPGRIVPLLRDGPTSPPWHSMPYQALPVVYIQNASLEIAWTRTVRDTGTISGTAIHPFLTQDLEGFDVNDPRDWWYAEHLLVEHPGALPRVSPRPWNSSPAGAQLG